MRLFLGTNPHIAKDKATCKALEMIFCKDNVSHHANVPHVDDLPAASFVWLASTVCFCCFFVGDVSNAFLSIYL